MAELTESLLREKAAEYERREPFSVVERERLETLPTAFARGSYAWKDAEWVVRWVSRRPLDGGPRPAESAFRENGFDAVESAIDGAVAAADAGDDGAAVRALTALEGVDVPVASAFLHYVDPERYLVVDGPCRRALAPAGELEGPVDGATAVDDYRRYLEACRDLARGRGVDLLTVSRALWRLERP